MRNYTTLLTTDLRTPEEFRELVVRANAGWVVLPLPFFDW